TQSTTTTTTTDLELHLLQSFGAFASDKLVSSYFYIKNSSRLAAFVANTTEAIVTKTGVVAVVEFLFGQYKKLGLPWVEYVDDAMGHRIIDAFVRILLLAKEQQAAEADVEAGKPQEARLSYQERIQALLLGEVPRLEQLLREMKDRESQQPQELPPVVMELKDFVPVEEVKRIREASREKLQEMQLELQATREQVNDLERTKQQLEQNLTDVHNYQESERGQRFRDMEEELARTKLEANQKAHDLRKMELVVEAFRKKRKSKGSRSGTGRSSEGNLSPSHASTTA
ncbi:TPA: hypothetical protein N0F65_006605, partial [Lagenidium giganteum]